MAGWLWLAGIGIVPKQSDMAGFRNRETVFDPGKVAGYVFRDGFMDGNPWHTPPRNTYPVTFLYESTGEHPHVVFY
jgi:hypothetical protein